MNINNYPEIKPGKKIIKKIYITVFLWLTGRAIQALAKIDKNVKEIFRELGKDFIFALGVLPDGPYLVVGKDKKTKVKYMGGKLSGKKITLRMDIKNLEAAMLLFTFRESTPVSFSNNRLIVNGDIPDALAISRVLDLVEVYLLPKIITKLAVKRYPLWSQLSPFKKHTLRILVYFRTLAGI